MGGAQPLAVTMNGGVAICVEVDPSRIARRIEHGYLDVEADDLDDALRRAVEARDARRPLSIGLLGNCAEVVPRAAAHGRADRRRHRPDLARTTRSPTCPRASPSRTGGRRTRRARGVHRPLARVDGPPRGGDGRLPGRRGRGLRLRQLHPRRGAAGRLRARVRLPRLRAGLHPAAVLRGQGPVPLGGAVGRPGGHRRDRPGRARPVPARTSRCRAGCAWPRRRSTSRACRRASAGSATASATRPGCGSTSWWRAARSARRS